MMRGVRGRVLAIGIACGVLGVLTMALATASTSRAAILRSNGPLLAWLIEHGERQRCEEDPEHWSLDGPRGAKIWAYDGETLRSHNAAAPPLSATLRAGLARSDQAVELFGVGRGGVVAARTARQGACAAMAWEWPPVYGRARLIGFYAFGGLVAAAIGAVISAIASARPLRELEQAHADLARHRDELRQQIADVAHDVRTPIASLQLALEQAMGAAGDQAAVEACLLRAVHDVVYVGGLVGNLRLASELRSGMTATTGMANLGEIVERAALRVQLLARKKRIALDFAVPDAIVEVTGDPIAIAQAVGNVIENAVAHGAEGGHVAVVLATLPNERFELTVVDDGPGVAPAELPRLGERTFRSDAARGRDSRGHGLGLAITSEVCKRLGWTLAFAHEEPQGLRVTIEGARS